MNESGKNFFQQKQLYMYEAMRYIFELIPDITKLDGFPKDINDETIADYFNFSEIERKVIKKRHKKNVC